MKQLITFFLGFFFVAAVVAQPNIEWQKRMGGTGDDFISSFAQTLDGGYIGFGSTSSNDGDVSGLHGDYDIWVVKLGAEGDIQWQKTFGGTKYDSFSAGNIEQTSDGGYIFVGVTESSNGDVSHLFGMNDVWVVKIDNLGSIQWEKTFGDSGYDYPGSIHQTKDGGYFLTMSYDPFFSVYDDYGLFKLDALGNIKWRRTYGGSGVESIGPMALTNDGGCVMSGYSRSSDGDVTGHHGSEDRDDYWIVKVDSLGVMEWERSLGGSENDHPRAIIQTTNGEYLISGWSVSTDGDVTGHHPPLSGFDTPDTWIVKLDKDGLLVWERSMGGSGTDDLFAINQADDGGFILAGIARSSDGDVPGIVQGNADVWLLKLSESGSTEWQRLLGGSSGDAAYYSFLQTNDGGYIFPGISYSVDGDVLPAGFGGLSDCWLVKLSPESVPTTAPSAQTGTLEIFPNPAQQSITINLPETEVAFSLSITDILGRELSRQTVQNGTPLDVSALPNGIYCATAFTSAEKVFVRKFNIQKG